MIFGFITLGIAGLFYTKNINLSSLSEPSLQQEVMTSNDKHLPINNSYSQEDISKALSYIKLAKILSFDQTNLGEYQGCSIQSVVHGDVNNINSYIRSESSYSNNESLSNCFRLSIYAVYLETYWVGDKIVYKHYKEKDFSLLKAGQNIALGPKPSEYLAEIIDNLTNPIIKNITNNLNSSEVETIIDNSKASGSVTFTINNDTKYITKFVYSLTLKADMSGYSSSGTIYMDYIGKNIELPPYN